MDFDAKYGEFLNKFNEYLQGYVSSLSGDDTLVSAMKYSLLCGGKRFRPVLALACADILGVNAERILPFALAIELIHTSSLIHDDLPALDNDDFRRGKPSNHKVYGESMAVIAGDALLNAAYELLFKNARTENELKAAAYIAKCSGQTGMLGGQALDIRSSKETGEDLLLKIDGLKTCKLIQAPILAAVLLAEKDVMPFEAFGRDLGLLFQFTDDVLDETGESDKLGKTVGKDKAANKLTAVSVYGLDGAKKQIDLYKSRCLDFLNSISGSEFLVELVIRIAERDR